uniref:Obscurin n=1 Tax=Chelonoidis abingdonii TaxID=106734 RepID=A0A8C0IUF7_CHEAB
VSEKVRTVKIVFLHTGNIIKKLPRKTAVSINDTAIFCVELDNECQNICWLKNLEEVKPNDRITITSSGKQHTLIIRECKIEDAGEIAFLADECRTSTQFTVSSKKPPSHPPSDPVVKNKTETSVTLAWSPPKMKQLILIDGYVVERKKLTGFTWMRCHQSHIPITEFTVSDLAEEADYQFRVSAVNSYGQSSYLEFPGTLHLEPALAVKTPLADVEAIAGGDATFIVDLTTDCSGTWYLNGKAIQSSEIYIIRRTKTTHLLTIKNVTKNDDGAEVKFVAKNVETSTKMKVKGSLISSISSFCQGRQGGLVATLTESATLSCEVAQAKTEVKWYKDGKLITSSKKFKVVSEVKSRLLVVEQVEKNDAGEYTCEAAGEVLVQKEVKASLTESATLSCEVAQAKTEVKWYKDGKLITSSKKFKVESEGKSRRLVMEQVEKKDAGEYTCVGQERCWQVYKVFENKEKVQKEVKAALTESATLSCEVTQAKTEVKWYKDGNLITSSKKLKVESEGKSRHLVVDQVEKKDAGEYTCEAAGQKLTFKVLPPWLLLNATVPLAA